jgi:hypothetical protein
MILAVDLLFWTLVGSCSKAVAMLTSVSIGANFIYSQNDKQ